MLKNSKAVSSFSVDNIEAAEQFYTETLGLDAQVGAQGLNLRINGSNGVMVYPKDDHQPATYTVLNFPVDDIDKAAAELTAKGVKFEQYEGLTDEKGIARGISQNRGPDIAWFKDPAGNILSILHEG